MLHTALKCVQCRLQDCVCLLLVKITNRTIAFAKVLRISDKDFICRQVHFLFCRTAFYLILGSCCSCARALFRLGVLILIYPGFDTLRGCTFGGCGLNLIRILHTSYCLLYCLRYLLCLLDYCLLRLCFLLTFLQSSVLRPDLLLNSLPCTIRTSQCCLPFQLRNLNRSKVVCLRLDLRSRLRGSVHGSSLFCLFRLRHFACTIVIVCFPVSRRHSSCNFFPHLWRYACLSCFRPCSFKQILIPCDCFRRFSRGSVLAPLKEGSEVFIACGGSIKARNSRTCSGRSSAKIARLYTLQPFACIFVFIAMLSDFPFVRPCGSGIYMVHLIHDFRR